MRGKINWGRVAFWLWICWVIFAVWFFNSVITRAQDYELQDLLTWDPYTDVRADLIRMYCQGPDDVDWIFYGDSIPAVDGPTSMWVRLLIMDGGVPKTVHLIRYVVTAVDTTNDLESDYSNEADNTWVMLNCTVIRGEPYAGHESNGVCEIFRWHGPCVDDPAKQCILGDRSEWEALLPPLIERIPGEPE